jgi:hypothetical protein
MTTILHSPTLDSILMVEEVLQHMNYPKKTELWKALPKKMMYQTFCLIIDYLEQSGKIMTDRDGRLIWTGNPTMTKRYRNPESNCDEQEARVRSVCQ